MRCGLAGDIVAASAVSAILGGIPSTLHAVLTGGDPLEATRAAGAMLVPAGSPDQVLIAAAVVVHAVVTVFWAAILATLLPVRHTVAWSLAAGVAIAVLDLKLIAPAFFPEVAALPFGPQLADHLAWAGTVGGVLAWRRSRRAVAATSAGA